MVIFRSYLQSFFILPFIFIACSAPSNSNPESSDCGNNVCDVSENCMNCSTDCGCPEGQFCNDSAQCTIIVTPVVCGNGVCENLEDCLSCPADCGCAEGQVCNNEAQCMPNNAPSCGDGTCENSEDCNTCIEDCSCEDGEVCSATGTCEQDVCIPQCSDIPCTPDGCGGICGECTPEALGHAAPSKWIPTWH